MSLYLTETVQVVVGGDDQSRGGWELARVREETAVERQWWEGQYLLDMESGLAAKGRGELVTVEHGIAGRNYDLIRMPEMINPELGQVNLLRPEALLALEEMMAKMRSIFPEVVFPVTAVWRTENAQRFMKSMFRNWAMEPRESTHHSGAAFDISLRSYWLRAGDGGKRGVSVWGANANEFDTLIPHVLVDEAEKMQVEGAKINLVVERDWSDGKITPAVLHVCAGPAVRV